MIQRFILMCLCLFLSTQVFAVDFLGTNLNDLHRPELTQLLIQNGAKSKKKDSLVDTFSLAHSKIPYATWAKAYYNQNNEFVGLKIIFGYEPQDLINLRQELFNKYGSNYTESGFSNIFEHTTAYTLTQQYYTGVATWKFNDGMSIQYDQSAMDQNQFGEDGINGIYGVAFLFFRNDAKRNQLINDLKEKSQQVDSTKFKGVF